MLPIPPDFLNSPIPHLPQENVAVFQQSLSIPAPTSIRLNPNKINAHFDKNESVKWCEAGKYLTERPSFTLDASFWAGTYYVQEASSMFVGEAVRQILNEETKNVLDLCAAPGGKSTHLSTLIGEERLLVSNEVIKSRVNILEENLVRWGNANYLITNNDPQDFAKLESFFDVMVIDAPCSGEGMFRKEEIARKEWSLDNVHLCSARQKRILEDVIPALKTDGFLIYSTCTYNLKENEENMQILLAQGFESIRLKIEEDWGIIEVCEKYEGKDLFAYRFFPHLLKGEGFFLACLQKKEGIQKKSKLKSQKSRYEPLPRKQISLVEKWLENPSDFELHTFNKNIVFALPLYFAEEAHILANHLFLKKLGFELGEIKGNDFVPAHDLAMNQIKSLEINTMELTESQALDFLRKNELQINISNQNGWTLATYQGQALGWMKILPNRINNYYPNHLRIKHL